MITAQKIKEVAGPSVWKKLKKAWAGRPLDTPLSIGDVLISNGLKDAIWCLRLVTPQQRVAALLPGVKRAAVFAENVRAHERIADLERFVTTGNAAELTGSFVEEWADIYTAHSTNIATCATDAAYTADVAAAVADFCVFVSYAAAYDTDDAAYYTERSAALADYAVYGAARAAYDARDAAVRTAHDVADAAAEVARAATDAERERRKADLMALFPPLVFGDSK